MRLKTKFGFCIITLLILLQPVYSRSSEVVDETMCITVSNSGIEGVDGIYVKQGLFNGKPRHVKGNYEIRYKGCRAKWTLYFNEAMYYRNMTDSECCPLEGWLIACKAKPLSKKVPKFIIRTTIN